MNHANRQNTDKYSLRSKTRQISVPPQRWRKTFSTLLNDYQGSTAVRLRDGQELHNGPEARCSLVFRQPGALRKRLLKHDLMRLGDACLYGKIEVEGELETVNPDSYPGCISVVETGRYESKQLVFIKSGWQWIAPRCAQQPVFQGVPDMHDLITSLFWCATDQN